MIGLKDFFFNLKKIYHNYRYLRNTMQDKQYSQTRVKRSLFGQRKHGLMTGDLLNEAEFI